ncbi:CBN-HPL-2 protein [Caenorhabditis brenneri]|uniref:CBN-HPL-2 protein n=1 Tax=Caenorhabditis brenneri TaxID=135651 RepID=G0MKZ7_CAEBE|nr:CBN-HPL-2 protein [Caenorhabditis brenneri]
MSSRSKKAKIEEEKGDVFVVEKVLSRRIGKAGREEFLIQWQGFPESDSSWEPRENLQCTEMLEQFEKESAKRDKPSTRRRQKSPEKDTAQPAATEQAAPNADTEPNTSDRFGLNGKQMKHIVGLTKATGELHFLCKFADDTAMLVPAKEVNSRYPSHVIKYYESKLVIRPQNIDAL